MIRFKAPPADAPNKLQIMTYTKVSMTASPQCPSKSARPAARNSLNVLYMFSLLIIRPTLSRVFGTRTFLFLTYLKVKVTANV